MALLILSAGMQPLGSYDGYDSELTSFKGGEIASFRGVAWNNASVDAAAHDSLVDGYSGTTTKLRPVVTKTLTSGMRPLFLTDDGTTGYGTLFGQVVGGTVGSVVTGGAQLGPHTATASGKVTLWDKPGMYGVTLDACDTTASTGLVAGNSTLVVGAPLYATAAGLLTPNSAASFQANVVVGRFIQFKPSMSLVTTPSYLTASTLSGGSLNLNFTFAEFWYVGAAGNG